MMIRLHARHKRTDQARGLFFEMQKWRCKPDVDTYNALIHAHGQVGQWRWALNIMEDMLSAAIPPSRSTYNNLINACGSSGNWREALKVCKKMTENGVGPDLYSKALSYFELMKGTHIRPDTTALNIVINCLVKLGQFGKAMDIFNSMRAERADSRPDIVTFTSIIHLYSVCGQIENCKAVFNAMLAEGIQPNIVSYNTLMAVYASHGMSKEAAAVFDQIKQNGFRPDVVSYTCLLNAYGRSQLPEKAREIFDMMKRNNCKPNLAVEVLRQMEQDGIKPNIVSICTLLAPFEKAIALYKSMRKRKVLADSVTYTVLISGSYKLSRYSEALGFLDDMVGLKIPLTKEVYSSLICVYSKQGQVAEAESMFNMIKVSGCCPDVVAYTAMLHAYNSAENWAKASAIFLEMEENGIQPDSIACSALMRAFNKGGQPSKVLVLAKYMREKAIPLNDAVFFEMVSACSM
ncbi:hypothetical protein ES332_D03G087400v1 [Gossypium tomentosum]|uniref:PROP1-like PPR domain-containing protein n=1 Tax=Gossypium tomentosum TaxID=34277 RepID=A0A5D2LKG9_GOSTO|nr:hypothetical protein ES332_D03G087400v1 [Gossypium tomentosum]